MESLAGHFLFGLGLLLSTTVHGSKVLLVSMDGFRWDYIQNASTPNFDDMAIKGTHAEYINPAFVTKSLPCHFTMVTGLYEESHGIIANKMYDPDFDETFNWQTIDTKWWDGGEPLWVTAGKQGLKTASYFWHSSETLIQGYRPDFYYAYNRSVPFKERVDTVVQWLSNSTFAIDFATLYLYQPDRTGHDYGPKTPEVRLKVEEMDDLLGYLVGGLKDAGVLDSVNIIVTSDHGMTEIDYSSRYINLSDYIDMDAVLQIPATGPVSNILPKTDMEDEIIENLTGIPHLQVFRKEDIPSPWHYRNHRRILPILAVADEGWMILKDANDKNTDKGAHGYDNNLMSMKPIFYARGPDIRVGYKSQPFNSVDIYPLVCDLLGIEPAPNNGTLDIVSKFITRGVNSASEVASPKLWYLLIFLCVFETVIS